jgi:hypothetical protein
MLLCTCSKVLAVHPNHAGTLPRGALSSAPGDLPDDLAHFHAARLVQQQHLDRAPLLGFQLLPRLRSAQKIRGLWACATRVGGLREMICARCEQHLADLADVGTANGGTESQMRHRSSAA